MRCSEPCIAVSDQSPERKPGTSRIDRPSPRWTPRPRKTGSRSKADSSRRASGSGSFIGGDGRPRRGPAKCQALLTSPWVATATWPSAINIQSVKLLCVNGHHDLGKRQAGVDRTRAAVLAAARELVAAGGGSELSVGAVARRAGVSRLTIYNRFRSPPELPRTLAAHAPPPPPPPAPHRTPHSPHAH